MSPGPAKQFDRQEVLGRALECFWSNGYESTGMTDLLDSMEIGRQSLYDTFGDKHTLFIEALKNYAQGQGESVLKTLEGPGTAMENLGALFANMKEFAQGNGSRGCLLVNVSAEFGFQDDEVIEIVQGCKAKFEAALVHTLDQARKEGDLALDLPSRSLARLIISVTQGLILQARVTKDPKYLDGVLSTLQSILTGK